MVTQLRQITLFRTFSLRNWWDFSQDTMAKVLSVSQGKGVVQCYLSQLGHRGTVLPGTLNSNWNFEFGIFEWKFFYQQNDLFFSSIISSILGCVIKYLRSHRSILEMVSRNLRRGDDFRVWQKMSPRKKTKSDSRDNHEINNNHTQDTT